MTVAVIAWRFLQHPGAAGVCSFCQHSR